MNLSTHYTLEMLTFSQNAARRGHPNVIPASLIGNAYRLCSGLLEPITARFGFFALSSGYRDELVNAWAGGSANSAHMYARAADGGCAEWSPRRLAVELMRLSLPAMDKCILEFDRWVHVQVADVGAQPRHQYLVASIVNGQTAYSGMTP